MFLNKAKGGIMLANQITNSKQKMKEKTDQKTCTRNLHNKPGDIALSRQIKKNKNARLYYLVPYVKFWSM